MARSVTLSTLIARVRRRVDIDNATNRFPDADITDEINESIQELVELIQQSWGQDYFRSTNTFTTTAGVSVYALPADFQRLISVDATLGGISVSLIPYMESERNMFKGYPFGTTMVAQPFFYRLTASNISFIPVPTGAFTINLNYIPVLTKLSAPSDTFDGIGGWEEYVVLDTAIKCAMQDELYDLIGVLEGRKAQMRARIESIATERDAGAPERVQDVVSQMDDYDW